MSYHDFEDEISPPRWYGGVTEWWWRFRVRHLMGPAGPAGPCGLSGKDGTTLTPEQLAGLDKMWKAICELQERVEELEARCKPD